MFSEPLLSCVTFHKFPLCNTNQTLFLQWERNIVIVLIVLHGFDSRLQCVYRLIHRFLSTPDSELKCDRQITAACTVCRPQSKILKIMPEVYSISTSDSAFLNFGFVPRKSNSGFPFVWPTLLRSVSSHEAGEEFDRTECSEAKENLTQTSLERIQNAKKAEFGVGSEPTNKELVLNVSFKALLERTLCLLCRHSSFPALVSSLLLPHCFLPASFNLAKKHLIFDFFFNLSYQMFNVCGTYPGSPRSSAFIVVEVGDEYGQQV